VLVVVLMGAPAQVLRNIIASGYAAVLTEPEAEIIDRALKRLKKLEKQMDEKRTGKLPKEGEAIPPAEFAEGCYIDWRASKLIGASGKVYDQLIIAPENLLTFVSLVKSGVIKDC
jgi:hypothetical protein